jgi:ankyrin repeat protein
MPNPTIAIWIHNKIQQEVKAKDEAEFLLFTCTRDLHMDFIDFLLQAGINIDARDRYGETPLMWAVNYGLVSMVRALLERGASLLIRDSQNRTALERALRQRNDRLQRYQDTQAIDAIITLLENPEKA